MIAVSVRDYIINPLLSKENLLGVGVTMAAPEAMVAEIARLIMERRGVHTVAAVNVHTFSEASRNELYRAALNDADIAFVDGVPIRWLLRACGLEAPPRIHGADLTRILLEGIPKSRHFFFGSTEETLGLLRSFLTEKYPGLDVAGYLSPPFRKSAERESAEMIESLNSSGADILWIALGAPKQELWAHLNRNQLNIPIVACVGAVFEIFAGRFSRAPRWLQRVGLEWAWRLVQDPWRLWRRYFATNGRFLVLLGSRWLRRR